MNQPYRHIYLSPHLDDAALSCGGMIYAQSQRGEPVLVVTVFAGIPDYTNLSAFARFQHEWWGNPADPVSTRREEDRCACEILGATPLHLDGLDAIYRRHPETGDTLYNSDDDIFGPLHQADHVRAEELAARIVQMIAAEGAQLYAPLAAGNHVDHQLVREAAIHLALQGLPVRFFEDFPYVADPGTLMDALAASAPGGWRAHTWLLDDAAMEHKRAALACYASQNPVIFRHGPGMEAQVDAYARRVGHGQPAERVWELVLTSEGHLSASSS